MPCLTECCYTHTHATRLRVRGMPATFLHSIPYTQLVPSLHTYTIYTRTNPRTAELGRQLQ